MVRSTLDSGGQQSVNNTAAAPHCRQRQLQQARAAGPCRWTTWHGGGCRRRIGAAPTHKCLVQRVADLGEGDGCDAWHEARHHAAAQQQGHAQRAAQRVSGVGAGPLAHQLAQRHLALRPGEAGGGGAGPLGHTLRPGVPCVHAARRAGGCGQSPAGPCCVPATRQALAVSHLVQRGSHHGS